MAIEKFHTPIKQEGQAGAIRGKISAGMAAQMNAGDGDVIEWTVTGKTVTGARVLRGKEATKYLASSVRSAPQPKAKPKTAAAPAKKLKAKVVEEAPAKKLKKPLKTNKRRTEVEYEESPKKLTLGKKKKKLRRS